MRRLHRYIGVTVLGSILVVLLVIVALIGIGSLIDAMGDIRGNYTYVEAFIYVGLTIPNKIHDNLPFACLVGCLIGLGGLANNSELTVMRAAGVSLWRLVGSVMRPIVLLIVAGVLLGEYVTPVTEQIAESRRAVALGEGRSAQAGQGLWSREGNEFLHINAVLPSGVLFGLTRYRFDDKQRLLSSSYARRATFEQDSWLLEDYVETRLFENRTEKSAQALNRWTTQLVPDVLNIIVLPPDELSLTNLYDYASYLEDQEQRNDDYWLAFWEKLLQPLATLSLVLIAISFIFGPLRQVTMGFRIFSGVVVGIGFQITQKMLGPASLVFGFSPFVAVLLPISVCLVVGFVLLKRAG